MVFLCWRCNSAGRGSAWCGIGRPPSRGLFEEFATSCLTERICEFLITIKSQAVGAASTVSAKPAKRGRARRGEVRSPAKESAVQIQSNQTLEQMRRDIPQVCDRSTQCNAQGFKIQLKRLQTASRYGRAQRRPAQG
jgi:hypothetical protein